MAGVENINSTAADALSPPPWSQIVRGPEFDSAVAPIAGESQSSVVESSDDNAGSKKPAWSKKPASEAGLVVMGADIWPALSESAKKLSPSNSYTDLPSVQKPITTKANHSVTPTHGLPTLQKSMNRDGGVNIQANGGFSNQNSLPREGSHNHSISLKTGSGVSSDISSRELGTRNPNEDHYHPRNSFRRGNSGTHSRGDESPQNYGGRHIDQRSFNGRDARLQPRVGPRGYVRPVPPPVSAPFIHHGRPAAAPMPPFMNPMVLPDMSMIYFPQGVPFVAPVPPPPMYFPVPDPLLQAKIVNQIDYYFSNENLIKDIFLRKNMDKDGWVPITLIASFKKVKQLTDNIQLILDVLRSNSYVVEVKGDKIRRRGDYSRWIMPPFVEFSTTVTGQSPNVVGLSAHFHNVRLDKKSPNVA